MAKTAINQFDITPGNNTDCDGVGVGTSMTVDNTNDAFQHLMALMAQQMGEVGAMSADIASAATTDLATAHGWFVTVTGTNTISSFGIVPAGKIFHLRMASGLTLTYNVASMILPNGISLAVAAGDIVTMLSLGTGNWRMLNQVPASGSALPPGTMIDYGGATAPAGWLLCNGQDISRTGYPLLYAAIGLAYGAGDGAATFNVPDFRGRAAVGDDLMGTSAAGRITTATVNQTTRGGVGGTQTHVLTEAELAYHSHLAGALTTNTEPDHNHGVLCVTVAAGASSGLLRGTSNSGLGTLNPLNIAGAHAHTVIGSTAATGSNGAHNNMQPSLICMKLIKT